MRECDDCAKCLPKVFDPNIPQPQALPKVEFGGVLAAPWLIPQVGTFVEQHAHAYDHLTFVQQGGLRVWLDGKHVGDFAAPSFVPIPAHGLHSFESLAPNTIFICVHAEAGFEVVEEAGTPGAPREGIGVCPPDVHIVRTTFREAWDLSGELKYAHARLVGTSREDLDKTNLELFAKLDTAGMVRSNVMFRGGVVVGYVVSLVAPALYASESRVGEVKSFHAQNGKLLLPLLAHAMQEMEADGVDNVVFRAGHRGPQPRHAALFQRLGAVPTGELFTVRFKGPLL